MGLCFSGSLPLYFLLFTIIVSLFYLANKFSLSLSPNDDLSQRSEGYTNDDDVDDDDDDYDYVEHTAVIFIAIDCICVNYYLADVEELQRENVVDATRATTGVRQVTIHPYSHQQQYNLLKSTHHRGANTLRHNMSLPFRRYVSVAYREHAHVYFRFFLFLVSCILLSLLWRNKLTTNRIINVYYAKRR